MVWGCHISERLGGAAILADRHAGRVQVRLGDVADVVIVPMPNEIKREAASRGWTSPAT